MLFSLFIFCLHILPACFLCLCHTCNQSWGSYQWWLSPDKFQILHVFIGINTVHGFCLLVMRGFCDILFNIVPQVYGSHFIYDICWAFLSYNIKYLPSSSFCLILFLLLLNAFFPIAIVLNHDVSHSNV